MPLREPLPPVSGSSPGPSAGLVLLCLAVPVGLLGVVMGLLWIVRGWQKQLPALTIDGVTSLLLGLLGGGVLAGLGWLVRCQQRSVIQQARLERLLGQLRDQLAEPPWPLPAESTEPPPPQQTLDPDLLRQMLRELREINQNVLLTDEERKTRQKSLRENRASQLLGQIDSALQDAALEQAEDLLEKLREEFPDDERIEPVRERLVETRQSVVKALVNGQIQRAGDLMSVSRFDEAISLARELREQYPDDPQTETLLQRVQREARTFRDEQRRRLLGLVQEHGRARQWRKALQAGHKLINDYPDTDEADQVRAMMPTLVDNARIEEVRDHRDRFGDLMDRRRYAEALDAAQQIIQNYPETAAADDLRKQLPRLSQLAQQPGENEQA